MKREETHMDDAVLTDVLTNLTEESKAIKNFIEKQQKVIGEKDEEIKNLVSDFEQKYESIQVIAPKPDMTATNTALDQNLNKINSTLESKLVNIQQSIEAGPKTITRHFRFLLFPESNTDYYYKMVFGRLIPWSFLFVVVVYLLSIGQRSIEAYQASQYNKGGNQCIVAWNDVYAHESSKESNGQGYDKSRAIMEHSKIHQPIYKGNFRQSRFIHESRYSGIITLPALPDAQQE